MDRATSRTRRLVVALGLNIALAAAQLVGGLVAHSTGLLSDAGHNITDVAGWPCRCWPSGGRRAPAARPTPSATTAGRSWPPWATPR